MKRFPAVIAATTVLVLYLGPALPVADACFDGYSGAVGRFRFTRAMGNDGVSWTPAMVKDIARWGARVAAILPPGTQAAADFASIAVCATNANGGCAEDAPSGTWSTDSVASAFRTVASLVRARGPEVSRALAKEQQVFTVQLFSARGAATADRIATAAHSDRPDDGLALHGFVYVGGFPGDSAVAHVVRGTGTRGKELFRVVTGAFLTMADAAAVRDAWKRHGFPDAFARAL